MTARIFIVLAALTAHPAAVLAHPGHVGDHGQGHAHWLALLILGGLALAGLVWLAARALRRAKHGKEEARS